jgi:hypothetical protein
MGLAAIGDIRTANGGNHAAPDASSGHTAGTLLEAKV